jgi:RNA polymerase sigma-70 factor (ECF subfamily)
VSAESETLKQSLLKQIPHLRAFAKTLCGDPDRADDLVQETLLKAWGHLGSFEEGTNLRAWLFTILRNTYFSQWRRARHEATDADGRITDTLAVLPEQMGHADMLDFRHALKSLTPTQRDALILVGAAGFSYEDAAKVACCPVGTVKSRVNRARSKLVELLGLTSASVHFGADAAMRSLVARSHGAR